jgi:hypothetical protein
MVKTDFNNNHIYDYLNIKLIANKSRNNSVIWIDYIKLQY